MQIMVTAVEIKKASPLDIELVYEISKLAYVENFAHHWNPGGLEFYLEQEYSKTAILSNLNKENVQYYLAFYHSVPAGFMKLNLNSILTGQISTPIVEVEKIYIRPSFIGKGMGRKLMKIAIEEALKLDKKKIWLGVIDSNLPAIEFYKKMGFKFFDKTTLDYPKFKEELRGMWRMVLDI